MNAFFQQAAQRISQILADSPRIEAFRTQFPHSQSFWLSAEGVRRLVDDFLMTDDQTYAIAVDGRPVNDGDHLLELTSGRDEVAIEFRHVAPHDGQDAAEAVYQWLRCAQPD